jgi:hypothetical protein
MKTIRVPCSFNTKKEIETTEILECKGVVKIFDELRYGFWM